MKSETKDMSEGSRMQDILSESKDLFLLKYIPIGKSLKRLKGFWWIEFVSILGYPRGGAQAVQTDKTVYKTVYRRICLPKCHPKSLNENRYRKWCDILLFSS